MKPGRIFNFILLAAMIVGAIMTYQTKIGAEKAAEAVAKLQQDIDREQGEIALLKAEYSMLMQPGRIQAVVEQHPDIFALVPFTPDRLGAIEEIPMRPEASAEAEREALAGLITGSVAGEAH